MSPWRLNTGLKPRIFSPSSRQCDAGIGHEISCPNDGQPLAFPVQKERSFVAV